jgi:hypothetical protein
MISLGFAVLRSLVARLFVRRHLVQENLALRHQLLVLNRTVKSPTLGNSDRLFWATLSAMWSRWAKVLVIVQPQTVVHWHQAGFRLVWRWKSQRRTGRPPTDPDYFQYYHCTRPHRSLAQDSPVPRPVTPPAQGPVVAFPQVGGLHHLYTRQAA